MQGCWKEEFKPCNSGCEQVEQCVTFVEELKKLYLMQGCTCSNDISQTLNHNRMHRAKQKLDPELNHGDYRGYSPLKY